MTTTDTPDSTGSTVTRTRQLSPVAVAVVGFLAVSLVLLVLGRLALEFQVAPGRQEFEPGVGWFGQWVRWDGNWYYGIAHDGYGFSSGAQQSVAFWPSYPMAMRGLALLTNDEYDAGLIITWMCGLATIVMLAVWCKERMTRAASIAAVVTLLVFPYAWYLHWSVYGDAMFAAFALGAFLLLERDRPLLAGLVGAVAAAGRPMGMAVAIGLVVLTLERRDALIPMTAPTGDAAGAADPTADPTPRWRRALIWLRVPKSLALRNLEWRDAGVLVAFVGPAAYMLFLWQSTGTPLAFADAESAPGWGHTPGFRTWFKASVVDGLLTQGLSRETAGMLLHGSLTLGALLLVPRVIRRFGWGYGLYALLLVGIPAVSSKDFYGLGRYMLAAFPIVAVAGEWLAESRPRVRAGIWSLSAVLLAFIGYSYARGMYVA